MTYITRSPTRCADCLCLQGAAHLARCSYQKFNLENNMTYTPHEQALVSAALDLAAASKASAALLPIPSTMPAMFVCFGEAGDLVKLVNGQFTTEPLTGAALGPFYDPVPQLTKERDDLKACVLKLQDSLCAAKRHEINAGAIDSASMPSAVAGVDLVRLMRNLDDTSNNEGSEALACRLSDCRAVISSLLAAAPAPIQGAVEWLRNNYQDYANVASLCDAMSAALAAPAAPAPASSDVLREQAATMLLQRKKIQELESAKPEQAKRTDLQALTDAEICELASESGDGLGMVDPMKFARAIERHLATPTKA